MLLDVIRKIVGCRGARLAARKLDQDTEGTMERRKSWPAAAVIIVNRLFT